MRIYDEGIFISFMELDIARSERFKIPFSLMAIKTIDEKNNHMAVLNVIVETNYRKTDVIAKRRDGVFLISLYGATEEDSQNYGNRLIKSAISTGYTPIVAALTEFEVGDTPEEMIERVLKKIQ